MKKIITTALLITLLTSANGRAAYCEKRIKCDANGCREIIDCR